MIVNDPIAPEEKGSGAVTYGLILQGPESTVCAEAPARTLQPTAYQSEAQLEDELVSILCNQGYERLVCGSEEGLLVNLRQCIDELNGITLTDSEWDYLRKTYLTNPNMGVEGKAALIQDDPRVSLRREDGSTKNVCLLDRDHIHRNKVQVMNQYVANGGTHKNRYDVTILVNGLPMVQVELKRRGVSLREAFNQIERYQRESFWSGCGLYEFVQVFVISNGTLTKYYSNTTRLDHVSGGRRAGGSTYEFTSWWTDAKNRRIEDLPSFARTFLSRGTLLMVLTHYCVLTAEEHRKLLVMRPYQICATERVLNRVLVGELNKSKLGTPEAGGYVWHTTGSGKTLTSFKCAQLASGMDGVDKVLFVVDRKDLDYQTMKEFNRFQEDAVNGSENTAALDRNLRDRSARICVTTIQKLSILLERSPRLPIYDQHVVMIFDECHRSQFGKMHDLIVRKFKYYHLFGFTGTPIFPENASASGDPRLRTTEQVFGDRLHSYTIRDAIADGNVLPFRVDYLSTMRHNGGGADEEVRAIDTRGALLAPQRIRKNVEYLLEHYDQKTRRGPEGNFSSMLATDSIPMARAYYQELAAQQDARMADGRARRRLNVAMIYSFAPNGDDLTSDFLPDESMDAGRLSASDREALDAAIADYNRAFGTTFSTDGAGFQNYYKDVSMRLKRGELDLLVVVDMFLTGFDAKTLNTLWVDKNLRMHGLIQAFSRTNRIYNTVKQFGNVVCFRDLKANVAGAISLFGDSESGGVVLLPSYEEILDKYQTVCDEVCGKYVDQDGFVHVVGEEDERDFVGAFGALLRLRNTLVAFDEFAGDDPMSDRLLQDLKSHYLDLSEKYRNRASVEAEGIVDDLEFEVELIRQDEVNVDYILERVAEAVGHGEDREAYADIQRLIHVSPELRNKADLVVEFVERMGVRPDGVAHREGADASELGREWTRFVARHLEEDLDKIIGDERMNPEKTRELVSRSFMGGGVPVTGTQLPDCLPKRSFFSPDGESELARHRVVAKLQEFYERYRTIVSRYPVMQDEPGEAAADQTYEG